MTREYQEPTVEKGDSVLGDEVFRHPAFGTITAFRTSGHAVLHGSDFSHGHFITLEINPAKIYRRQGEDRTYPDRAPIVRLMMSEAQWATFVSSLNCGSGVPVTLTHVVGQGRLPELPPMASAKERFDSAFKRAAEEAAEELSELDDLIVAAGLSKKKTEELRSTLRMAKAKINDTMPYLAKSFDKHMEKSVEKAKVELHGYAMNTLLSGDQIETERPELPKLLE